MVLFTIYRRKSKAREKIKVEKKKGTSISLFKTS